MTLGIEAIKAGLEEIEETSTFEAGSDYDSADYWSRVARTQVHFTRSLISEVERLQARLTVTTEMVHRARGAYFWTQDMRLSLLAALEDN